MGLEFWITEQLHPKSLKKILRQTGCAPLPTPLVLTLQSKMVVNSYMKNYLNAKDQKNFTSGFVFDAMNIITESQVTPMS
ncbi:MAG TPA: hypothetical protein DHU75_09020 [Rikenellaceae bacterium]|nr:hypothetical protein [Rikenellaceae bacterium]